VEHLFPEVAEHFMSEARRVLRPGGILRVVVPDLFEHARRYVTDGAAPGSADALLRVMHLSLPRERNLVKVLYNCAIGYPTLHKTMYDHDKLARLFAGAGFGNPRSLSYGESAIPDIALLEGGEAGYEGSLYFECPRP
jgi:predicted SAM-dependent methyltransferase